MSIISESKFIVEKFIQNKFYLDLLTPTLPFRLLKSQVSYKDFLNPKLCLPLNRFTDPLAFSSSLSHMTIWSEKHLQFLKKLNFNKSVNLEKVVLKNPFKTQQLIKDSIEIGLKNMVVDSFDQIWKIHQCRCLYRNSNLQYPQVSFLWKVTDFEHDQKQIETLKTYKIKLGGLIFDKNLTKNIKEVQTFIEKINGKATEKKKIYTIYLETESENFDTILQKYQDNEFFLKNKIQIILEKTDFKMTDKYWIAAKIIGQNRRKQIIVSDEAYQYITSQQIKKGKVVEQSGKKWIFSTISYFPDAKIIEEHQRKGYIEKIV